MKRLKKEFIGAITTSKKVGRIKVCEENIPILIADGRTEFFEDDVPVLVPIDRKKKSAVLKSK